jgi:hypothetical protein
LSPETGIRIRDEQPGLYFQELKFLGVKTLKFFDADPGWKKIRIREPGSWMEKIDRKATLSYIWGRGKKQF